MAIARTFSGVTIQRPGMYGPTHEQTLYMNLFRTLHKLKLDRPNSIDGGFFIKGLSNV